MEKVGIYVCECGPNIKEALDVDEVARYASTFDQVVLVRSFGLLCSKEGRALIAADIKEQRLTRVMIAACSPKEHEMTFRRILENAGLNPFLLQMANIREQCAWVTKDKAAATQKAKAMVKAALKRVVLHEPLQMMQIECRPDVLVIGAGIAGISAALALSQKNRQIYVIEKSPCIGGKTARYEDLHPTLECAACRLDPLLDQALHDEQIQIQPLSEVCEILGSYGNFTIKVKIKARYVDPVACLGCELCFDVCPVKVKNEFNEMLDDRKAIYIPYAGALPNVALIDNAHCLHFASADCDACQKVCPFGCIDFKDADRMVEFNVGAIVVATGFDLFDPGQAPQYGYGKIDNVYTSLEFERLLSSTGPTGGQILLKAGNAPKKIVFVHCVGSRTEKFNEHCSGICCSYLLKFAHQTRKQLPAASIGMLYSDLCLPGKSAQAFCSKVSQLPDIKFHRMKTPDAVEVDAAKNQEIIIRYVDSTGTKLTIEADMVVLAASLEGAQGGAELGKILDIPVGAHGFFAEEDAMLAAVSTVKEGVFLAGCAQGPMDIQQAVAQGQAAAGKILQRLIFGEKLELEATAAQIDQALCSGCKACMQVCVYQAIGCDDASRQVCLNEILCKGCGVCVVTCPSGAITARHFTDGQITAEINGLMQKD
jgi:heterodisulfide reductase subunit A